MRVNLILTMPSTFSLISHENYRTAKLVFKIYASRNPIDRIIYLDVCITNSCQILFSFYQR